MLTKTREKNSEKNDLETNHFFSIPENIRKDINNKWFFLYEWIWTQDVKLSIERDFLKSINTFWVPLVLLFIIPGAISYFIWWTFFLLYSFWFLWIINIVFVIFLILISINRSLILGKNAYILLTTTHISIDWKIEKLKNFNIKDNSKIKQISTLFEEELFMPSNIEKTKKWFLKQVLGQIWKWFGFILKMWKWKSREWWQLMIILLFLYIAYIISLGIIYIFWIFLIWIFWIFITIINKQILLISGHQISNINNKFRKIDYFSKVLTHEKNNLSKSLTEVINNDWKDNLLTKINSWIWEINKIANVSIDTSIELKKDIKKSKYNEMFDFSIYNSWLKKQIHDPLTEIKNLLFRNLSLLNKTKNDIILQIEKTKEVSLRNPLELSKKRIESQINVLSENIWYLNKYLQKLS